MGHLGPDPPVGARHGRLQGAGPRAAGGARAGGRRQGAGPRRLLRHRARGGARPGGPAGDRRRRRAHHRHRRRPALRRPGAGVPRPARHRGPPGAQVRAPLRLAARRRRGRACRPSPPTCARAASPTTPRATTSTARWPRRSACTGAQAHRPSVRRAATARWPPRWLLAAPAARRWPRPGRASVDQPRLGRRRGDHASAADRRGRAAAAAPFAGFEQVRVTHRRAPTGAPRPRACCWPAPRRPRPGPDGRDRPALGGHGGMVFAFDDDVTGDVLDEGHLHPAVDRLRSTAGPPGVHRRHGAVPGRDGHVPDLPGLGPVPLGRRGARPAGWRRWAWSAADRRPSHRGRRLPDLTARPGDCHTPAHTGADEGIASSRSTTHARVNR